MNQIRSPKDGGGTFLRNVGIYFYFIINNQRDAALNSLIYYSYEITLHVSGAVCTHHQEYIKL